LCKFAQFLKRFNWPWLATKLPCFTFIFLQVCIKTVYFWIVVRLSGNHLWF
jgi:hypothetical protein